MPSVPNDAVAWLDRAERAREAAEKLVDPDAKEAMLLLAQLSLQQAVIAHSCARKGGGREMGDGRIGLAASRNLDGTGLSDRCPPGPDG